MAGRGHQHLLMFLLLQIPYRQYAQVFHPEIWIFVRNDEKAKASHEEHEEHKVYVFLTQRCCSLERGLCFLSIASLVSTLPFS